MNKTILIALVILINSCASVYITSEGQTAADKHQKIAILPPKVGYEQSKKIDAETLKEAQRTSSIEFQQEIYKWLLKRNDQGRINIAIQDVEETNMLLKRNEFDSTNLTVSEICQILDVDGVLYSNFNLSKPTSQGAAIAAILVFGLGLPTNRASASMSIKDCESSSMIWNYDHEFSGGIGSSPKGMVDYLMRNASKKLPYFK